MGTPKELVIRFPETDPDQCIKTSLELWGAKSTLKCWCNDGTIAHRRTQDNKWVEARCKYRDCPQYTNGKDGGCGPVGRFRFIVPAVSDRDIWQLDTRSWNAMSKALGLLAQVPPTPDQLYRMSIVQESGPTGKFSYVVLTALEAPAAVPVDAPEEGPDE